MLEELKEKVLKSNLALSTNRLIALTWGNVSGIDRKTGYIVIKPSGVSYENMKAEDMVVIDVNGRIIEGKLNPSSDAPTHIELYKAFSEIGGIVHTHSRWATVFAQCGYDIPILGTTHADTFYGDIPCTRKMKNSEITGNYEKETGRVIIETFADKSPYNIPAVLVHSHGSFTWGENSEKAVENAIVLEETAMMAWHTLQMNPNAKIQKELSDKHFFRKHGKNAYYGQTRSEKNDN